MDLLPPLVVAVLLAPVLALAAVLRTGVNRKRLEAIERQILSLQRELHAARTELRPAPIETVPGPERVPVPAVDPVPFVAPAAAPAAAPVAPTVHETPPPLPAAIAPPPVPPAPAVTSLESRIGARWLSIAGAAALFLGTVFLLKWTIDQGWFGPRARLVASTVLGVALWLGGLQWRRRYAWLGASLMGAGSCVLYATAWSGDVLWDLLSPQAAWGAMLAVTAATLLGSHLLRLLPLALIGLGGGFLAPWLVQLEATSPHGLLVWSTVLALGAAFLRVRHEWGWMLPLAAVGNCLHAVSWTALRATHDTTVQLWAAGFVLLALGAGSLRNVLRVQPLQLADNLAVLLASGMWLVLAVLAEDRVAGWLTCTVATALAAVLTAAALRHRRALPADRVGTDGLWLPAGLLLLASVPFAFEGHALAIGLGVHATVLGLLAVAGASPTLGAVAVLGLGVATWVCVLDRWDPGMWPDAQLPQWAPWTSAQFLVELLLVALFGAVLRACVRNQRFALAVAAGIATSILVWQGVAGNCMATLELPGWYELLGPMVTPASWALGGVPVALAIGSAGTRGRWSLPVGATACGLMLFATLLASSQGHPNGDGLVLHYSILLLPVLAALWTGARTQPQAPPDWNHFLLSPVCWSFLLVHLLARECYSGMAPLAADLFAAAVVFRGIAFLVADRSVPWRGLLQVTPVVAALPLATAGLIDLLGALLPRQALLLEPPPPAAVLPLGLAFALPPALCAIGLFRQGRSRRAPLWLAGLASVLSLVAVREPLEFAWQAPVALVAPCMSLLLLALAVFGPGSFRSTWRAAFAPLSSLLAMLAVLTAEAWRRGAELSVNPNHGGHAGVSIAWVVVAAAWLASGFAIRSPVLRLCGLALFAVTLTKLTLVDLAALPVPFRILSFLGLGGALLGCGWLYNRFARRIEPTGATQPGQAPPS